MKHLTNTTIQLAHEISQAHHPLSGAVVLFSGEVRATNKNKEVLWLEYEAYDEMAEEMIANIVDEAKKRWHLNYAACVHRTGKLEIGECAVVVVTSGGHRGAAYEANRYIIDEVKSHVPIWKHEFFADGTQEWGQNDCTCHSGHGKKMEKFEDTPPLYYERCCCEKVKNMTQHHVFTCLLSILYTIFQNIPLYLQYTFADKRIPLSFTSEP